MRVACAGLASAVASVALVLGLSCAARPARPSASASRSPSSSSSSQPTEEEGDRADPCDLCVLQGGDGPGEGEDGCPGPDFRLTDHCILPPGERARIERAASEIGANVHMTSVRIVSGRADCAGVVRAALEQAGVASGRLEIATRDAGASASLEVGAWDGRRCAGDGR
jgi:hypothetical protein